MHILGKMQKKVRICESSICKQHIGSPSVNELNTRDWKFNKTQPEDFEAQKDSYIYLTSYFLRR